MKTMKKLASLTLALLLTIALAAPAFAVEVTINANPATGTDTGETYRAYKIFDAAPLGETAENPGTFTSVAYSFSKDSPFHSVIENYKEVQTEGEEPVAIFDIYGKDATTDVVKLADGVTTFDAAALAVKLKEVIDNSTNVLPEAEAINKLNLGEGYYLITSTLGSRMIVDTFGEQNMTINTKNEFPTLTLTADKTSAAYGEIVTYTVTVHIPATAKGAITVTPTLDNEMTVATAIADGGVIDAETVAANLDSDVTLTFTATLNDNAATGEENPHTTKAQLTYSSYTSVEAEASVYTYEFDLIKTNSSNIILSGATFELYDAETAGNKITLTEANGANATGVISAGVAKVKGLAAGTYYLEETAAPDGYNRMQTRQAVTLGDMEGDKNGNISSTNIAVVGETYDDTTGGIEVENLTGAELPSTGGIGTTIFYVVGGLLAVGAGVLLITRKRAGEEE